MKTKFILFLIIFQFLIGYRVGAQENLIFGTSTALTGPTATLGENMLNGIKLAFEEQNKKGGIRGKLLEIIAYDDGYEPERTVPNMEKLVANPDILGIIGNVGTPTAVVSIPIAVDNNILFYGAFTGAGILRKNPPDRVVFNYRASYAQETAAMVKGLIEETGLEPNNIAFFTQRDAYGDAGFNGGIKALKEFGLKDMDQVPHGRYERNTIAVENALAEILDTSNDIKAIIMVGAYEPCAEFINLAQSFDLEWSFFNVSFVGSNALAAKLKDHHKNVYITQVVPPFELDLPVVNQYKELVKNDPSLLNFGSFEGYISSRVLILNLESIEGIINRNSIVDQFCKLKNFDVGVGVNMSFCKGSHQASNQVWLTHISNGKIIHIDWTDLNVD